MIWVQNIYVGRHQNWTDACLSRSSVVVTPIVADRNLMNSYYIGHTIRRSLLFGIRFRMDLSSEFDNDGLVAAESMRVVNAYNVTLLLPAGSYFHLCAARSDQKWNARDCTNCPVFDPAKLSVIIVFDRVSRVGRGMLVYCFAVRSSKWNEGSASGRCLHVLIVCGH
jgi:hypothetical protein